MFGKKALKMLCDTILADNAYLEKENNDLRNEINALRSSLEAHRFIRSQASKKGWEKRKSGK